MRLLIHPDGLIRCVYAECIDLAKLGRVHIRRASRVEADEQGRWWADLAAVAGPKLGPFALRSGALAAEEHWLERHWMNWGQSERSADAQARGRGDRSVAALDADRLAGPGLSAQVSPSASRSAGESR